MSLSAIPRASARALLLVLALFGALGTSQGLVLCVAPGDHIAIETAIELAPCLGTFDDGVAAQSPVDESCSDTPLLQASLRAGADTSAAAAPTLWQRAPLPHPPVAARVREVPDARGGLGTDLRAHRTIVLLV